MRISNNYSYLFFIVISLALLTANCSDDSSSVDPGEEPEVPEATPYEIDNSLFEDAEPEGETSSFQTAEMLANSANLIITGVSNSGSPYLNLIENREPEFVNDVWVWEFTVEEASNEITIRATAEDQVGAVEWNIYFSGTFEGQNNIEEFRFARGLIEDDGSFGEWDYFSPENQESPIYTYEWTADSDTDYQIISTFSGEGEEAELNYRKENEENILEFNGFDNETTYSIFWNSDTGEGYVDDGSERNCWDENYQNVEC